MLAAGDESCEQSRIHVLVSQRRNHVLPTPHHIDATSRSQYVSITGGWQARASAWNPGRANSDLAVFSTDPPPPQQSARLGAKYGTVTSVGTSVGMEETQKRWRRSVPRRSIDLCNPSVATDINVSDGLWLRVRVCLWGALCRNASHVKHRHTRVLMGP